MVNLLWFKSVNGRIRIVKSLIVFRFNFSNTNTDSLGYGYEYKSDNLNHFSYSDPDEIGRPLESNQLRYQIGKQSSQFLFITNCVVYLFLYC